MLLVCLQTLLFQESNFKKINGINVVRKTACLKWTFYVHFSNDYRVGTLSKSYLTVTGIIMQSLKLAEQF